MTHSPVRRQGRLLPWRRTILYFGQSRRFAPIHIAAPRSICSSLLLNVNVPLAFQLIQCALDGGDTDFEVGSDASVTDETVLMAPLPVEEVDFAVRSANEGEERPHLIVGEVGLLVVYLLSRT